MTFRSSGRLRSSRTRSTVLAVVVLATVGATACSAASPGSATSTSSTPAVAVAPSSTAPATPTSLAVVPTTILPAPHVGALVSIPAVAPRAPVQVTLVKFVDPAQGADRFSTPVAGGRLVGVQLQVVIGGNSIVREDLNGDTSVSDAQGNLYAPTVANLQSCPAFNPGLALKPGKAVTGCAAFQVPSNATITQVTFTPGGQFGYVSAQWRVP